MPELSREELHCCGRAALLWRKFNAETLCSDYTAYEANYKHLLCLNRGSLCRRAADHTAAAAEEEEASARLEGIEGKGCFKETVQPRGAKKKRADSCSFTENH